MKRYFVLKLLKVNIIHIIFKFVYYFCALLYTTRFDDAKLNKIRAFGLFGNFFGSIIRCGRGGIEYLRSCSGKSGQRL